MSIAMPAIDYRNQGESLQPSLTAMPNRRIKQEGLSDSDRNFAIAIHLSPFAAPIFGPLIFTPLVLWLIRRKQSQFVDDHGREVLNMQLSSLLFSIILAIGGFLTFGLGWLALAVWHIVIIISQIRGAIAAGSSEYFRYPMIIRFLS